MHKIIVFCLFVTVMNCENVKRQTELAVENPFLRYRYTGHEISEREWQRRCERETRNQRQRATKTNQQALRYIVQWLVGDDEENEQQRWRDWTEEAYARNYERNIQPWSSYESQAVDPWEDFAMSFLSL